MEWLPTGDNKSALDQESAGDIVMTSSGAVDNTLVDLAQPFEMVVPKEPQTGVQLDRKPSEPDPFGQVFSGANYTKLPAAELLGLQTHQLQMIRDLGYAPKVGAAGPGFSGAAYSSLVLYNVSPFGWCGRGFFDWAFDRLTQAAEASQDLGEFVHALTPNITFNKTELGWEVYYGGVIRMQWGARPISAANYVDFFLSSAVNEWENAQDEAQTWEDAEEEAFWEAQEARNCVEGSDLL